MKTVIDLDNGIVNRQIFFDPEVYRDELARIFGKCWLFLAHESQLLNPGDFLTTYMGEVPVLVTRSKADVLGAYFNSCRHRGMRVCRADAGNANTFMCSYHGWVYRNDGRLQAVPRHTDGYPETMKLSEWDLVPVGKIAVYKGLIFATWDPNAPSLSDYLGDMAHYLDIILDRREGGTEFVGGTQKWTIQCNWKFVSDNHVGDSYHTPVTHHSGMVAGFYSRPSERLSTPGYSLYAGNGHGLCLFRKPLRTDLPMMKAYVEEHQAEAEARLGQPRATVWPVNGAVFPNFGFVVAGAFRTFRVWHPKGPDKVEIWSWCIVDKAADPAFKDFIRSETLRGQSGPASTFEQDDGENFKECHACTRAPLPQDPRFNYMLRLGAARAETDFPGRMNDMPSETNQLGFYEHWAAIMGLDPSRQEGSATHAR